VCERGLAVAQGPLALADEALEAMEVELVGLDAQHVAVRARREQLAVIAKRLAQLRDAHPQRRRAGRGLRVAPQVVHEPIGGDHLAGVEQQDRKEGALAVAGDTHRDAVVPDLQRPQDAKVHLALLPATVPPAVTRALRRQGGRLGCSARWSPRVADTRGEQSR
jgi:hypothetical protein